MSKKKSMPVPAMGGSSLLVIFAVLCLIIFALLGLSSVQADSRMAEKALNSTIKYYQANVNADDMLARIREGDIPSGVSVNGDVYSFKVDVSETQVLDIAVRVSGSDYEILRWKETSSANWTPSEDLNVFVE